MNRNGVTPSPVRHMQRSQHGHLDDMTGRAALTPNVLYTTSAPTALVEPLQHYPPPTTTENAAVRLASYNNNPATTVIPMQSTPPAPVPAKKMDPNSALARVFYAEQEAQTTRLHKSRLTPALQDTVQYIASQMGGQRMFLFPLLIEQSANDAFREILQGEITLNDWARRSPPTTEHWKIARQMTAICLLKSLILVLTKNGLVFIAESVVAETLADMFGVSHQRELHSWLRSISKTPYIERECLDDPSAMDQGVKNQSIKNQSKQSQSTKEKGKKAPETKDRETIYYFRLNPELAHRVVASADAHKPEAERRNPVNVLPIFNRNIQDIHDYQYPCRMTRDTCMLDEDILDLITGSLTQFTFWGYADNHVLLPKKLEGHLARYALFAPIFEFFSANRLMFARKKAPTATWKFLPSGDVLMTQTKRVISSNAMERAQEHPTAHVINPLGTKALPLDTRSDLYQYHPCVAFAELLHKHVIPPSAGSRFPTLPRPILPPPSNPSRFYKPSEMTRTAPLQ